MDETPRPPIPVHLAAEDLRSLEVFLGFRGDSAQLKHRIRGVEADIVGRSRDDAAASAVQWGVDDELLHGAQLAKRLSAQVDVVLHAAGIVRALPYVLHPNERVQYVSLGAGNTGRDFDLETDRRVAEFKFISWMGGPESVRQDNLLIDLFHLARADTSKRRVMYITGAQIPMRFLSRSTRNTRACLGRRSGVPQRFDEHYGPTEYTHVHEYWSAIKHEVEVIDLVETVPGFARHGGGEPADGR